MTERPRQLAFDLDFRAALGREDFLVGPSNSAAVEAVEARECWPQRTLGLVGQAGSGKSHLVEVWRRASRAVRLAGAELTEEAVAAGEAAGAVAIEDIDRGIGDEQSLFHLFNLAREGRLALLVTSRALPGEMEIALPDLRSRLRAMALARIEPLTKACCARCLSSCWPTASSRSAHASSNMSCAGWSGLRSLPSSSCA